MFAGFVRRELDTPRGHICMKVGGEGPPLLLLHGYPQTSLMWRDAGAILAERFTVVAADLPGYGDSFRPVPAADHAPHSKRALAQDLVAAMAALGHQRFSVAGHDRGGRVAYRMALDHPDRVSRLAVLDIVPTAEVWARLDRVSAIVYWHWSFLAQPAPLPERMITADPAGFLDEHVRRIGLGATAGRYPEEVMDVYRRQLTDPGTIEAICEDYRAGASIDVEHDREGGTIGCPVLALWGSRGALELFYGDVLDVWRPWAPDLSGGPVDATHFLVEDEPELVAGELGRFFAD
ncbi:MAG: alpha/beta hydrolase [Solirubrobacteraceae bacterium]